MTNNNTVFNSSSQNNNNTNFTEVSTQIYQISHEQIVTIHESNTPVNIVRVSPHFLCEATRSNMSDYGGWKMVNADKYILQQ